MSNYYLGNILFDVESYPDVVTAFNFIRSKETAISVERSIEHGGKASLSFAFKEGERGMISKGCSLREIEMIFNGCELQTARLAPCVKNPDDLSIAARVEAFQENDLPLRVSDIKPMISLEKQCDPFEGFVGLGNQIDELKGIAAEIEAYKERRQRSAHMLFVGNPGTGKTTIAEAFGSFLRKNEIINGPFHQVSAETLIGVYAGSTPSIVNREFSKARGGVLFIDEAYRLTPWNDNENPHGREAINAITELMERDRKDTIVICAGYPDEMDRFLQVNSGLRGRFTYRIEFPDYSSEALVEVFAAMAHAEGFDLEEPAKAYLFSVCDKMRSCKDFSNARSMRDLLNQVAVVMAVKFGAGWTINADAIRIAYEKSESGLAVPSPIGFFS